MLIKTEFLNLRHGYDFLCFNLMNYYEFEKSISNTEHAIEYMCWIIVNRGKSGYETRQTSKEQTKMPGFMLEGP